MEQRKRNKTKIVIIVLAVLLALSLITLAGTFIYNKLTVSTNATVTVPDNLITPDDDKADNTENNESNSADEVQNNSSVTESSTDNKKSAIAIALYNKQPQDNTAFAVGNMFPGDSETKYYRVQVSYHDKVTVHFKADVRNGYKKLAEVLKIRIKLLSSDKVMYDGLMKDMPDSVTYKLASLDSTTDELYYEITAYLDTSVGNKYQNKDLIADFYWWVEETGNLDKSPHTGDVSNIVLWSVMAVAATFVLLFLLVFRRKKEDKKYER